MAVRDSVRRLNESGSIFQRIAITVAVIQRIIKEE